MKLYSITTTENRQPIWQDIPAININQFPWYKTGKKQNTQIKLCANNENLFIQIIAQDNHSFAQQTQLNHMLVCEDSCVEFFFSPSGQFASHYVNLEVNCCGTMHLAFGSHRDNRQFITLDAASLITVRTSVASPVKLEKPDDIEWSVDITLPFAAIEALTGEPVNKNKWYGNFYRCGGRIDPQYAVWNSIESSEPDFHRPEHFGELIFL